MRITPSTALKTKWFPTAGTYFFSAVVRNNRNRIEDAANHGRIAAARDDGLELFAEVVAEVEKGTQA